MKKILIVLIIACVLGLAACSSGSFEDEAAGGGSRNVNESPAMDSYGGGFNSLTADYNVSAVMPSDAAPRETERKIIRNAYMGIESKDPSGLFGQITAFNRSLGGYEFMSEKQNFNGEWVVNATLKVPPDKLDTLMNFVGENGQVINSRVESDDVTDDYFDMKTRVESRRRSLESYYSLLEKADSVDEILKLQRTIDGIIEDIEAFEGRLRVLDNLTDMATVTLYIAQEVEEEIIEERREIDWSSLSADDVGYFIKSGFVSVVSFFVTLFQWLFIALAVTSPIWVPVFIVMLIVLRKRKRKKTEATQELKENNPE
jgi:hypothetical protein